MTSKKWDKGADYEEIKQRKQLTKQDIAKIIEQDLHELLCPFWHWDPIIGSYCGKFFADYKSRCTNPREWENCPFFTDNWEGI